MGAIFSENGQRNIEKGQNTWKFGQKMYKNWRYSEKGLVTACDNCMQQTARIGPDHSLHFIRSDIYHCLI